LGMRPLATPTERAETCVVCHVGSAEADMNHDLIAAGHPRLNFEFSAFYANMPRHWAESDADLEPAALIRSWAEGQVVTARAALELTAVRAASPHPWPEFAEYDCFACHHDLHAPSWRQQRGFGKHLPGTPLPSTWYLSMPRAMAQTQKLNLTVAALDKLQGLMNVPYPNREAVAAQAKAAADQLGALQKQVTGLPYDREAARKWFAGLADEQQSRGLAWDEAAQLYLALAAYDQAYGGADNKKAHEAVEALYKRLAFPRSQNSPGKDASAEHFKGALKDLEALLKAP
ncbi:MAG TPA: hypothetical protein VJ739_15640, partial [Gemmataceae bacterium]|nr:hypothetical protein [Gemmataceae bacterium]